MDISLTKLPWYAQIGAFVVLSLGGAAGFYYYYEVPARADIQARENTLKSLRAEIAKGQATEAKLPEFRAEVESLEARLDTLSEVLPEDRDAADLLRQLQTTAVQSNLVIKGFKPSPVVSKQLHAEWPINLELEGTYHSLAQFFDRVGKFARIVNISNLSVKGKDKGDPRATITASCVATTFVLNEKPALKKAPGTPAAPGANVPKKVA